MPYQYIAERDAKGHIIRPAGDYLEILAAGRMFNWASPYRRMCAKCRRPAMRGSESCWVHDPEYRKRRAQRAIESGDPSRIAKVPQRKHRAMMATIWRRDPWFNGRTVWLAPKLEEQFRRACADAALPVETVSPRTADNLRWQWRLYRLDENNWPGWELAVAKARRFEHRIGEAPPDWTYQPPGNAPPGVGSPVVVVTQKSPVRWRATQKRTPKMKAVLRKVAGPREGIASAEAIEQVEQFLFQHHKDLREVFQRLGKRADDPQVRAQVARAWASALCGEYAGYKALRLLQEE
jgi:hypothetical protein